MGADCKENSDISNKGLAKLLSLEVILPLLALAVAWGANSNRIANAEDDIIDLEVQMHKNETDRKEIRKGVANIQTTIGKVETNQDHLTKSLDKIQHLLETEYGRQANGNDRND